MTGIADAKLGDPEGIMDGDLVAPGENARWYAVHTQPKREFYARLQLEGQGFRVFLPKGLRTIRHARKTGRELDSRLLAVAAWRHSSEFTVAERAALELTEEMTRLADRSDPVPDDVWNRAAEHFDERALAALVLHVSLTNLFNRLNVSTRQPAGDW